MTPYGLVVTITLTMLAVQQTAARQIKRSPETSTLQSFANLSTEELVYILKSRNGVAATSPKRLTPCARAILGCCNDKKINENCSESLKCGAYFFDDNPCEEKFLKDALMNAKSFYEQFNQGKKLIDM